MATPYAPSTVTPNQKHLRHILVASPMVRAPATYKSQASKYRLQQDRSETQPMPSHPPSPLPQPLIGRLLTGNRNTVTAALPFSCPWWLGSCASAACLPTHTLIYNSKGMISTYSTALDSGADKTKYSAMQDICCNQSSV